MVHQSINFSKAKKRSPNHHFCITTTKVGWQSTKKGVFDASIAKTMLTNYFEKTQKTAKKEWQLRKIAVAILQIMKSNP